MHGNVRRNPKLSGTTHNVFGIQVGVGITILVRNSASKDRFIRYHRVPEFARRSEKLDWLAEVKDVSGVEWQTLAPNAKNAWLTEGLEADFDAFVPLGSKEAKASFSADSKTIFKNYSIGVSTNRDSWVYDFDKDSLESKVLRFIDSYNAEVERWKKRPDKNQSIDDFVDNDDKLYKWSLGLKNDLKRGAEARFDSTKIRTVMQRPFCKKFLFFDSILNEAPGQFPKIFPSCNIENRVIWVKTGTEIPFFVLMTDCIPDLLPQGGSQCFPLYTFSADGGERFDNITGFALDAVRAQFGEAVSREDIFYAVYALLHAPTYRAKFAENLKRELPRLPLDELKLSGAGWELLVETGRTLGDLHVGFESVKPFALSAHDTTPEGKTYSFRVEKMRWLDGKSRLKVNDSIELSGFTPEMFAYKLGNRSALDWVVESFRVKDDKRSGLTSDPNREQEPRFILDLIGRVARVSLETQELVARLPELY